MTKSTIPTTPTTSQPLGPEHPARVALFRFLTKVYRLDLGPAETAALIRELEAAVKRLRRGYERDATEIRKATAELRQAERTLHPVTSRVVPLHKDDKEPR